MAIKKSCDNCQEAPDFKSGLPCIYKEGGKCVGLSAWSPVRKCFTCANSYRHNATGTVCQMSKHELCKVDGDYPWQLAPIEDESLEESAEVDSKIAYGSKKSTPFLRAFTEVWRVAMFGEGKHGPNNCFKARPDGMHFYEEAMMRHLLARRMGETHADDSQCLHLAHAAWNALFLLEMELRGVVSDQWSERLELPRETTEKMNLRRRERHDCGICLLNRYGTCRCPHVCRDSLGLPFFAPADQDPVKICATCGAFDAEKEICRCPEGSVQEGTTIGSHGVAIRPK